MEIEQHYKRVHYNLARQYVNKKMLNIYLYLAKVGRIPIGTGSIGPVSSFGWLGAGFSSLAGGNGGKTWVLSISLNCKYN